jgi:hypothetical protein
MSKPLLGLILGAALGLIDGTSALIDAESNEEVRTEMVKIVVGSTFKGLLTGLVAGCFARKVDSTSLGIVVGVLVGLFLAYLVSIENGMYVRIMTPGGLLGAIVGFATQRYGHRPPLT